MPAPGPTPRKRPPALAIQPIHATTHCGSRASDTRMISGYRLKLGRHYPTVLNASEVESCSLRIEFTNPSLDTASGSVPAGTLHLRLDRVIGGGLHEDYDLTNYGQQPVDVLLEVSLESDFADLFDVKSKRRLQRGEIQANWQQKTATLINTYTNHTFRRAVEVQAKDSHSTTEFANGGLSWKIHLEPAAVWHTCLLWAVDLSDGQPRRPIAQCSALKARDTVRERARRKWSKDKTTTYETSDPQITATLNQAVEDLSSLRLHIHDRAAQPLNDTESGESAGGADAWVPAAGIPWFVSLFGRDSLIVSLQTLSLSPRFALGALHALARLQADSYDDRRDMQPGKIEHEVRHGELATLRLVPHTPYYGTHEATTLYVWAAARAWAWHADRKELDALRPHVERALAWIDTDGDIDGDGLQEYQTRAGAAGYYNQGWKDSGEAIVDEHGKIASLPIALCEHQGYVVAAKRAWAQVLETVYHDTSAAKRLREQAKRLAGTIEELFWWEEEGTYYLGLDGSKQPLRSVASNPAHLLWARAIDPERASRTAARLLARDMWSGWGIRTLAATHPAYNPFSYQLGSVWPHDNIIAAAGMRNYGLDQQATQVIRAIFDAAGCFRSFRLPELFAGIDRDQSDFPVQYLGANVPQAWASGAIVHAAQILAGLDANAAKHELTVNPALPEWLPRLHLRGLGVGEGHLDLTITRHRDGTYKLETAANDGIDIKTTTEGGA